MFIITPISIGTILIILLFIVSPIYMLGIELKDLFLYLDAHQTECIVAAFLIFLVISIISLLITKELNVAIPIFLNGPMIGIAPAFWLAEFFVTWSEHGLIWALFTQFLIFLFQLFAWLIIIAVGAFSFLFCADKYLSRSDNGKNSKNKKITNKRKKKFDFIDNLVFPFGISAIALLIQYFLFILVL